MAKLRSVAGGDGLGLGAREDQREKPAREGGDAVAAEGRQDTRPATARRSAKSA